MELSLDEQLAAALEHEPTPLLVNLGKERRQMRERLRLALEERDKALDEVDRLRAPGAPEPAPVAPETAALVAWAKKVAAATPPNGTYKSAPGDPPGVMALLHAVATGVLAPFPLKGQPAGHPGAKVSNDILGVSAVADGAGWFKVSFRCRQHGTSRFKVVPALHAAALSAGVQEAAMKRMSERNASNKGETTDE